MFHRLQYIRTIQSPSTLLIPEIYLIEISPTLGDIVTAHDLSQKNNNNIQDNSHSESSSSQIDEESYEVTESNIDDFVQISMNLHGKCILRLNTINGKYVNHILMEDRILCICCTSIKEGTGVNAIVTGMEGGIVKFWSSWDLSLIRQLIVGKCDIIRLIFISFLKKCKIFN